MKRLEKRKTNRSEYMLDQAMACGLTRENAEQKVQESLANNDAVKPSERLEAYPDANPSLWVGKDSRLKI